jgi:hypothetical protein
VKLLLRYHQRLGDIIQCLSMCRQLARQGHEMYLECNQEYHTIFRICPYVMPIFPGQAPPRGFRFDHVIDPQIWPQRYYQYRASKQKWWEFTTSLHPLLGGLTWQSPFLENVLPVSPWVKPESFCLIAHTGFSQVPAIDPQNVVALAQRLHPTLIPLTIGIKGRYRTTDLCDLVSFVQKAGAVVTINTSVDFMADSLREKYDHVICSGHGEQDDFFSEKQVRHSLT